MRFSLVLEAMAPMVPTAPTPAAIVEGGGEFSLSLCSKSVILPSHAFLAGERIKTGSSSIFLSNAEFAVSIAWSMDMSPPDTCPSKYRDAASISCIKPSISPSPLEVS